MLALARQQGVADQRARLGGQALVVQGVLVLLHPVLLALLERLQGGGVAEELGGAGHRLGEGPPRAGVAAGLVALDLDEALQRLGGVAVVAAELVERLDAGGVAVLQLLEDLAVGLEGRHLAAQEAVEGAGGLGRGSCHEISFCRHLESGPHRGHGLTIKNCKACAPLPWHPSCL